MFIIFGTTTRTASDENGDILPSACSNCRSDLDSVCVKNWFTLFFIPIFPIGTVNRYYQCNSCGATFPIEQKQALLGSMGFR